MNPYLAASLAGLTLAASALSGQTTPPAPSFDVAVIKAAALPTPETFRSGQFRTGTTIDADRADFEFISLADLLPYAFRVKSFQVSGPEWMGGSRWNIQATLPQGVSKDLVPEMMQALLADRFKLAVHHEKREQPVYELVVAKGGPRLEVAEPGEDAPNNGLPGLFGGLGGPPPPPPGGGGPGGPPGDGRGGRGGFAIAGTNGTTRITPNDNCGIHLELTRVTMSALADTLTPFLEKPVLDATELKGPYKVVFDLPIEILLGMMQNTIRGAGFPAGGPGGGGFGGPGGPGRGGDGGGPGGGRGGFLAGCAPDQLGAGGTDGSKAALFQAVQKLGLKLEQRKAPFDTIVVDHLEKTPTEN